MGYTLSPIHGIEVPDGNEPNNISEDIGKIVAFLESGSLARRMTQAEIDALPAGKKPNGLIVFNTTSGRLEKSNGATFEQLDWVAGAFDVRSNTSAISYISSGAGHTASLGLTSRITGNRLLRWALRKSATPETGAGAGSDLEVVRYDDAGNVLGVALTIRRTDGRVTLGRSTVAADPAETVVTKGLLDLTGKWSRWTPVVYGGTTVLSGCTTEGSFTRIGDTVHWECKVVVGAATGGTGTLHVGGDLPEPHLQRGVMGLHTNDADTMAGRVRGFWNGLGGTPPQLMTFVGVTLPQNNAVYYASGTYQAT